MTPRRKNATKHSSPTASQSEGHNASESSSSEVQINTTIKEHSPRTTRSQRAREILQNSPSQSEEESSGSGRGEELGSQSDDGSGGSVESARGSQEDVTTSPPVIGPKAATETQTEVGFEEEDDEVTSDDMMVLYVNLHKFDLVLRQQLIDYFRSMWTVNRSEYFFNNGIVNKLGGFKNRLLMPETRVVMADIQAFPDIYRLFQLHQFEWMNNAPGEYTGHLPREFYVIYAATLMNMVPETKQLREHR
ncbi:hypothetical protein KY284_013038 [Solanum tuberosum]|nr:hypothetical protein KY284_013038 [Solanum tuberosum]